MKVIDVPHDLQLGAEIELIYEKIFRQVIVIQTEIDPAHDHTEKI